MEAGALRFRAPKGALTPQLRAEVQARNTEIIAALTVAANGPATIPLVARDRPLRMSFGQERIWFLYRLEGPSSTYNITPVFRLRGLLSLDALRAALRALAERHETLRMRFAEIDGQGVQLVDPAADVPIAHVSLTGVREAERMAAAERLILAETARPFDLERQHALRATVIALGIDDHILLPFMHHIVADGWSLGVLQREISLLYEAFLAGRTAALDALPVQYPDYAAWQRAAQDGERGRTGLDWWRTQLAGAPQTLALPYDFPRPAQVTFNGRVLHRTIPEATTEAVEAYARTERCSLFMVLLAAYAVLLRHHTGQDEMLIGSPVAGRPLRELEGIIGCFVNTLVLRLRVADEMTFSELLREVRATALAAYEHQDVPIEAVIDAVATERDPARNPLFQAQFSLQNVPVAEARVTSLAVEHVPMDRVAAKNDLSFILQRRPGAGIHAELEYNTDLFDEATVRGLGDDFVRLLDAIAAAPGALISALPGGSSWTPDDRRYWIERLGPLDDVARLAFDTGAAADGTGILDAEVRGSLTALGTVATADAFAGWLAAAAVYLRKYTGLERFALGVAPEGRSERPNVLALPLDLVPDMTFAAAVDHVRTALRDAYVHQRYPIARLQADLGGEPLIGIVLCAPGIHAPVVAAGQTIQLELLHTEAGYVCRARFAARRFGEATMRRLIADLDALVETCTRAPQTPLRAVSLLTAAETQALRARAAAAPLPNDDFADLVSGFAAAAARYPDREAVRDAHGVLTYAELERRADAVAAVLLAHGLAPESPVGLLADSTAELIVGIAGILKAGGAYVPLSPDHPLERRRFMLEHAAARALLADRANAAAAGELVADGIALLVIEDAPVVGADGRPALPAVAPSQLAYVVFTSGSTGRPKGVMIEHRSVVNLVHGLRDAVYRELAPDGAPLRIALVASPVFDASVQQIFAALLYGHTLCIVDPALKRDAAALCAQLHEWRIDCSDCTPSLLGLMLHGGLIERCGETLHHLLVGGEPLPADLIRALHATERGRNIAVTNVYGPTECCVDVVAQRIDGTEVPNAPVIPIGRALRNCFASIVDRDGRPVPAGIPGELMIAGLCVGRGYVNDPVLTSERFVELPALGVARAYRTGDLCRASAGGVIEFLGRNDEQVKILGHRIELGEVEHHLRAHPAIADVSVQARATVNGYRELVAYLVLTRALTAEELRTFASARLPAYMVPAYFVPLATLPLNASGKVARQALPDPATVPGLASGVAYAQASTPAERILAEIWCRTLRLERAGIADNYFASGGDSIKALQLAARLREAGWIMQIRDLFLYPTIAQLAPHLRPSAGPAAGAVDGADVGIAPLSATQRFFFTTYGPSAHFNQAILLRPRRPVTLGALRAACATLAARHGMLRARFVQRDGAWQQEVLAAAAVEPLVLALDLRAAPDADDELQAHAAQMQRGFALERAPLWSAVLYDLPEGQRLLLSAHHLIVDGVSWRVLVEDLERTLSAQALPPSSAPYAAWVDRQHRYATAGLAAEHVYWPSPKYLPAATDGGDRYADRRDVRVALSAGVTRALLTGAHKAYATEINDLLIAAVVAAWRAWTGEMRCALTLEGHGREPLGDELDIARTVGWFTSVFPVAFELPPHTGVGATIKHVKETLRGIPNRGAGYGILRFLAEPRVELAPLPPLAFNYLGRFETGDDGWFAPAPEPGPATAAPELALPWLELTAAVVGEEMDLALAYSVRRYDERAARAFLDHVRAELERVVEHTLQREKAEFTASDFDYADFTPESLDDFLRAL